MSNNREAVVVIPAFNESAIISDVLADLLGRGYEVIVVDDGSTDRTSEEVKKYPCIVCRHSVNLGQGAALQTGIKLALRAGYRFIVSFDADGQHDARDIEPVLAPLRAGRADVVLGSRFAAGGDAINIPQLRYWAIKLAVFFTRVTTGLAVSDTHNGLRAFDKSVAAKLCLTQNRMAHASEILTQIQRNRWRYEEVAVRVRYTPYSRAKGQSLSNSFNILWDIVAGAFRL